MPHLATCIFLFSYDEPGLGVGIDPGMASTPLPSSIGQWSNRWPSDCEPSARPQLSLHDKKFISHDFFLGLLQPIECSKPACSSTADPVINKCYQKDGYNRVMLYRAWNTSCPPLLPGMTIIHEIDQFLMINQLLYTHNFQDFFYWCW